MTEKKVNILVVDDDPVILDLIAAVINTPGYHVRTARDGVEALRLVDVGSEGFDLLLIDVVMPRLNGRELARVIQSFHPKIKMIFMSGYPDDVLAHHGIPASNIRYIKKPFTPYALVKAVVEVLKE